MDFAYRYRKLLLAALQYLPPDLQAEIHAEIQEEDRYLEGMKPPEREPFNLEALADEVESAEHQFGAAQAHGSNFLMSPAERVEADLAYQKALCRLTDAKIAYEKALRAVLAGAPRA